MCEWQLARQKGALKNWMHREKLQMLPWKQDKMKLLRLSGNFFVGIEDIICLKGTTRIGSEWKCVSTKSVQLGRCSCSQRRVTMIHVATLSNFNIKQYLNCSHVISSAHNSCFCSRLCYIMGSEIGSWQTVLLLIFSEIYCQGLRFMSAHQKILPIWL